MEFVASLIHSLAWPIVVLALVLVFRSSIRGLLSRPLKEFKAGPLQAVWEYTAGSTRRELDRVGAVEPIETELRTDINASHFRERMLELAGTDPLAAVNGSYDRLEQEFKELLAKHGVGFEGGLDVL